MSVAQLQRLGAEHRPAILAFELENRSYFTASIGDRGGEYFDHFDDRYDATLALQGSGLDAYFVLVGEEASVLGRFNLIDIDVEIGMAELGYRVAQRVAGRGMATGAVQELCRSAALQLGLRTIKARTTLENIASQRVLLKSGFRPSGAVEVAGRPGAWYLRELVSTTPFSAEPELTIAAISSSSSVS
jgi:ribosomal-protein-alanine N-acetyltransferase